MTRTRIAVAYRSVVLNSLNIADFIGRLRVHRLVDCLPKSNANKPVATVRSKTGAFAESRRFFAQRLNLGEAAGLLVLELQQRVIERQTTEATEFQPKRRASTVQ